MASRIQDLMSGIPASRVGTTQPPDEEQGIEKSSRIKSLIDSVGTGKTSKLAGVPTAGVGTSSGMAIDQDVRRDFERAKSQARQAGIPTSRIEEITSGQEEPNAALRFLGKVVNFAPVKYGILKPLEVVDTPRRFLISGARELVDVFGEGDASFGQLFSQARDTSYGFGTAFANPTGNKWLDRAIGFTGDVLLDPITYLTFGTGGLAKQAATGALKAGVRVGSAGTARAAARAGTREALESGLRRVAIKGTGRNLPEIADAGVREAVEQIAKAQRVGPRRVLGARSREELAQGAREIREEAIRLATESTDDAVRANAQDAANILTDDVISDLATRGYAAARGDIAEVLGLRGGLRIGINKAQVVIPYTERLADTAGALISGARIGGITARGVNILPLGFADTAAGQKIIAATTPTGEGGVFGSEDILRMRNALRTGTYEGRKLTGKEGNEFVKLLAADKAFRGIRDSQLLEAQQLIRPLLGNKSANTVVDLLDTSDVVLVDGRKTLVPKVNLLDPAMTPEQASAKLGREVTPEEFEIARQWRQAGDEFYERANYLHQRAQLSAGIPLERVQDLPKNQSWFPHALTERAQRDIAQNAASKELTGLFPDRSFAKAGSNVRRLKAGETWFGYKLTEEDIAQGVKRLNQIAREKGGLKYDVFATNADTAFTNYAAGWGRDSAYTNWLFNMALATAENFNRIDETLPPEVVTALRDMRRVDATFMDRIAQAEGSKLGFQGKGFQDLLTQEQVKYAFGVPVPTKLEPFARAINDVLTPERVAALNTVPAFADEMARLGDEIAELALDIDKKKLAGKGVFQAQVNQALNDFEQRLFELQRLAPDVPAGYGAASSSEAAALYNSLKNEAEGLVLKIGEVDPKKWVDLVPMFLDNATQFLQINSRNYPGLIASPEVADMIKNFRRLEDPKFAMAMNKVLGPLTQMFKGWVTAFPGFHLRNALSNTFFMLSAGADPVSLTRGMKIFKAYSGYLKRTNLEGQLGLGAEDSLQKFLDDAVRAAAADGATLGPREIEFLRRQILDEFSINQRVLNDFFKSPEFEKLGIDPFEKIGNSNATIIDILNETQYGYNGLMGDIFEGTGKLGISGRLNDKAGRVAQASRLAGKPLGWSRSWGNAIENYTRFALTYDGILRGMSPEASAARTAKYMIDYQDLSTLDKNVKSVIPFWMWTSRSFPLIVESSWANPRAYALWNNFTRNMTDQEGMEDQSRPYYLRSSFKLPFGRNIYGNPDFGFQRQEEAFASLTDPRSILAGMTPVLRAPLEAALNQQFRTGGQVYSPYYQEGTREQLEYILKNVSGVGSAAQRVANLAPGLLNIAQLPGAAGALEQAPGVGRYIGAPEFVEREQGPQTTEASLQALARFFGLPFYNLQPFQQESALREQTKLLEQEATRRREEEKRKRGR